MSKFKQCNYSDNGKRSKYKSEEIKTKSYYDYDDDVCDDCPDKNSEYCDLCRAISM